MWIKQHDRCSRAEGSAKPVGAINHQIHSAAHARRDQLINCRIDRGIFSANARSCERAKESVAGEVPGKRRQPSRHEIDRDRNEEQFFSTEPIRPISKKKSAEHSAGKVESRTGADLRIGQPESLAARQDPT